MFVARTIIDCTNIGRGFTFAGGEDNQTVINGFTIINGGGNGVNGGGLFIDANSSPFDYQC